MVIVETAPAKINLTLCVLGRRADGYHEIESLVTFAGVGDRITLTLDDAPRVATAGPFAVDIEGANLLERALTLIAERYPSLRLGIVHLEKNLPVAAGVGGGSADAAALLRAVRAANLERAAHVDWHALAADLGADVPVCLSGRPAIMSGIGERVAPLPTSHTLPDMPAVLVNPRLPLSTVHVFRALAARPLAAAPDVPGLPGPFANLENLIAYMRARGNDLEVAATRLLPAIAEVKAALAAQDGCRIAALSGSGPTCFGLFADPRTARAAAARLANEHPGWWVTPTELVR